MSSVLSKEIWLGHIKRWEESGLSINKYCEGNGLRPSSFHYWIRKSKKGNTKPGESRSFVKFQFPESGSKDEHKVFSLKYGNYEITIPSDFNRSELGKLLDVLEARHS